MWAVFGDRSVMIVVLSGSADAGGAASYSDGVVSVSAALHLLLSAASGAQLTGTNISGGVTKPDPCMHCDH